MQTSCTRKDQFIAYSIENVYKTFIEEGGNRCALYVCMVCVSGGYMCMHACVCVLIQTFSPLIPLLGTIPK